MYIWYKTLAILSSTYQKLLKLMDIWRSSDTNSFAVYFETRGDNRLKHIMQALNVWNHLMGHIFRSADSFCSAS